MTPEAVTPTAELATATGSVADRWLLRAVDAGLACCVLAAPWFLGGRHPLGQLVLVSLAVLVTSAWVARACLTANTTWRISGAEAILLAAIGLVIVQLVPLPDRVLHWLSPQLPEILPLWSADGTSALSPGRWRQISLVPGATTAGLVLLLTYAMLFWTTLQRISKVEDVERLLRWLAWAAVAMAALGLLQLFAGNGKFFWLYEAPLTDASGVAKGSFTNRNHFAHFLALGVGAVIWWILDARRGRGDRAADPFERQNARVGDAAFRWLGLGLVVFAVLLSLSRGGAGVTLLAAAVSILACRRAGVLGARFTGAALVAAALVAAALAIHGHQAVGSRMSDLVAGSIDTLDPSQRRRIIWTANLHGIADFATFGAGVGSHQWVCPMYLDPETLPGQAALAHRIYFTHAENGPLQTTLETGLPGLFLLLSGIAVVGYWCIGAMRRASSPRVLTAAGAVAAALAASLVHSLVDFVWYVPACTALIAILAAAACRLHRMTLESSGGPTRQWSVPPGQAWAAVAVLVVIGGWMIDNRVGPARAAPHWDACRRLARDSAVDVEPFARDGQTGESFANDAALTPAEVAAAHPLEASVRAILAELEQVVRLDPTHHEARLQLAGTYLLLFECVQHRSPRNAMPLSAIREAAIDSRFASRAELDAWLEKAVGEHADYLERARRHARIALRQCPLEGAGYLYLGELSFLAGVASREAIGEGVEQALRVRPHHGGVLLSAGQEAVMAGSLDQAVEYWRRAYRLGPAYRKVLVRQLAGKLCPGDPAAEIDFFFDAFEPDLAVVRQLEAFYGERSAAAELVRLREAHARLARDEAGRCVDPTEAGRVWIEARLAYVRLDRPAEALECLREAVGADPGNAAARRRLAASLLEANHFDEAEKHLQWCAARKPDDPALRTALRRCAQGRLALERK